jgi:hypothetical protein
MPRRCMGEWMLDPHFLDLGTSWRWVVSFAPLPLYSRGKSHWYPFNRRLGGAQSRPGQRGEGNTVLLLIIFITLLRPQPPNQWVPGTISLAVKRQGREAEHSPPTSAKVKKMWIYAYAPPYAFMASYLHLYYAKNNLK